jgi:hypothetical protein
MASARSEVVDDSNVRPLAVIEMSGFAATQESLEQWKVDVRSRSTLNVALYDTNGFIGVEMAGVDDQMGLFPWLIVMSQDGFPIRRREASDVGYSSLNSSAMFKPVRANNFNLDQA